MKQDYSGLDAAIIKRLSQGSANFTQLQSGEVERIADALAKQHPAAGTRREKPSYRYIDGRLQALRKAGKIAYNTKTGWGLS